MGVAGHGLWSPDEPREAAMSLSMAKSGDWVIPRLAGTPFVEKPPLYYITAVWSIKAFGPLVDLTTAIRMTTALYGIGTLLMTFLLGYRIGGLRAGFLSAVFLGTMEGFVENFHWIRVDAALSFFVVATVVCLREMYHEDRYEMGALAGAFMAGSFLSKGFVGPVLCGIPWAVLFIHRLVEHRTSPVPFGRFVLHHLVLGCVFVLLSGLWVLIFYMRGDEALWHEWFWVNHVGRLTGEAVEKGHIIRGKPLYYVFQLLGYAVPWSPLVFFWFGEAAVRAVRERCVSRERLFLFGWGVLSLVVLTVSATKRGIYLTPVLPVFAVTAALAMGEESPRWFRPWGIFWIALAMGLVLIVAFCPFFTGILPGKIPPKILESLSRFGGYNILSLFGFAICPYLIHKFRLKLTDARALVLVTAVLYISLSAIPPGPSMRKKTWDRISGNSSRKSPKTAGKRSRRRS
jgi:4-amino-4-deoxy-L-arabinose transferase-like glycosyltransferase